VTGEHLELLGLGAVLVSQWVAAATGRRPMAAAVETASGTLDAVQAVLERLGLLEKKVDEARGHTTQQLGLLEKKVDEARGHTAQQRDLVAMRLTRLGKHVRSGFASARKGRAAIRREQKAMRLELRKLQALVDELGREHQGRRRRGGQRNPQRPLHQ